MTLKSMFKSNNNLVHALRKTWSVRLTSRIMHFGWYCPHLSLLYDRLQVETGFPLLKSVSRPSDSSGGDKPEINWLEGTVGKSGDRLMVQPSLTKIYRISHILL